MIAIGKVIAAVTGEGSRKEPAGTIHVVDPSPLNWLYITYNTVEELVSGSQRQQSACGHEHSPLG